ncbi:sulfurtransferase [Fictibacillus phosphorivorans]|uniref:sulfurtransferase n=1 Tax=Fictibacillus phosphorivorans TaxID=1221500 RepID=UPI00203BAAB5|nr:sulfurtransferase [Fictibacillus phosphorivorans]MCM3719608.1 sulfurtransferase [Fictibacillus phosphorivorans]MCM3777318.1 sulfurtransferase [Fictibacillus phosphorivorans]
MSNLVSPEWVNNKIRDKNTIVIDCRFSLADPEMGYRLYEEDHIEGAFYADLEKHLSGPLTTHGGRHPLPSVNILSQFLSDCGVDNEKIVVAYDDQSGTMAARFWWLMKYMGLKKVYVMQGGYTHYKEKGYAVSSKVPDKISSEIKFDINTNMISTRDEVVNAVQQKDKLLIDARESKRFKGETEPIDPVAGHIPTAVNVSWDKHFSKTGWWKDKNELRQLYKELLMNNKKTIVYCGSGVTACVNILAMDEAGFEWPLLYAGSWSDWISYTDHEVEKG